MTEVYHSPYSILVILGATKTHDGCDMAVSKGPVQGLVVGMSTPVDYELGFTSSQATSAVVRSECLWASRKLTAYQDTWQASPRRSRESCSPFSPPPRGFGNFAYSSENSGRYTKLRLVGGN